jgi:hypothetical protein
MKNRVQNVYVMLGEEEGDFTMEPLAIVILMANGQFRVYSVRAEHNRLRAIIHRNSWTDLEAGVEFKSGHYRLQSRMDEVIGLGWTAAESIPEILVWLRNLYPRHLFFLDQHIEALL